MLWRARGPRRPSALVRWYYLPATPTASAHLMGRPLRRRTSYLTSVFQGTLGPRHDGSVRWWARSLTGRSWKLLSFASLLKIVGVSGCHGVRELRELRSKKSSAPAEPCRRALTVCAAGWPQLHAKVSISVQGRRAWAHSQTTTPNHTPDHTAGHAYHRSREPKLQQSLQHIAPAVRGRQA